MGVEGWLGFIFRDSLPVERGWEKRDASHSEHVDLMQGGQCGDHRRCAGGILNSNALGSKSDVLPLLVNGYFCGNQRVLCVSM